MKNSRELINTIINGENFLTDDILTPQSVEDIVSTVSDDDLMFISLTQVLPNMLFFIQPKGKNSSKLVIREVYSKIPEEFSIVIEEYAKYIIESGNNLDRATDRFMQDIVAAYTFGSILYKVLDLKNTDVEDNVREQIILLESFMIAASYEILNKEEGK